MRILTLVGFLSLPAMAACGSAPQTGNPPATQAPGAVRTSHTVQQGNVTIEVIAEGSGPLMVLLPSLGRDVTEFDPLAERLRAAGFRIVRPRPRGFGRSVGPMEGLTLHDFARDTAAVVEHERAGLAIMVGHAYGHFVAKMTASDFPHLVRGVALVAASQKNISEEVRRWNAIGSDPTRPLEERRKYIQMVFFAPGNDPTPYLTGFSPEVRAMQDATRIGTPQQEYWASGTAPLLDLQAAARPLSAAIDGGRVGERVRSRTCHRCCHPGFFARCSDRTALGGRRRTRRMGADAAAAARRASSRSLKTGFFPRGATSKDHHGHTVRFTHHQSGGSGQFVSAGNHRRLQRFPAGVARLPELCLQRAERSTLYLIHTLPRVGAEPFNRRFRILVEENTMLRRLVTVLIVPKRLRSQPLR